MALSGKGRGPGTSPGLLERSPENNRASRRIAGPSPPYCSSWKSTKVGAALYVAPPKSAEAGFCFMLLLFLGAL